METVYFFLQTVYNKKTTYMRRISALLLRAPQVTYYLYAPIGVLTMP